MRPLWFQWPSQDWDTRSGTLGSVCWVTPCKDSPGQLARGANMQLGKTNMGLSSCFVSS